MKKNSYRNNRIRLFCISLFFLFPFSFFNLQAQQLPLSPTATASVITCGPGNDFYTTFGHSALRITDTARGLDLVYNYGTFDFDTPHFYWKFAKGRLDYCLARSSFEHFRNTYEFECRYMFEQRLWLTPQEVSNLFVLLETNHLPQYRYYKYDFFRDNCATRVRDMVQAAVGYDRIVYAEPASNRSYRNHLHAAMRDTLEWCALGIDMLLGAAADHRCTPEEEMFSPIAMMQLYAGAQRVNATGGLPLTDPAVQLLQDTREPLHRSFPPLVVFALFFIAVSLLSWKRLWPKWADRVLFAIAGLVGCFLIFMWTGTEHYCTKWNLNILWASPFFLLIAIRLEKSPRWFLWLQAALLALSLIVAVIGWPQQFNLAVIPLILTLLLRTIYLIPRTPQRQQRLR